jgi:hypothetical protein
MRRPAVLLVAVLLATVGAASGRAMAQSTVNYTVVVNNRVPQTTFTIEGIYWPATAQLVTALPTNGGTILNWNAAMYGLDLRFDTRSHWGIHLNGVTGNQGSWSYLGTPAGELSLTGTDTIWSADVSYTWQQPLPENGLLFSTFRAFLGWGDAKASTTLGNLQTRGFAFNSATLSEDSGGVRVGFDASYPFSSGWSIDGGVAYFPSTTTTGTVVAPSVGASTFSVGGTGWDAAGGIRYTSPSHWTAEVGYRVVKQNQNAFSASGIALCPCSNQWSGPYVEAGVSF